MEEQQGTPPASESVEMSPSVGKLFEALANVQAELEHAEKNSDNPFFKSKYADLSEVLNTGRKVAAKHGISVTQFPVGSNGLITILGHSSGEYIKSRMEMKPTKNDPQGVGSTLTYMRRYAYSAVLGIAQADDDANVGSGNKAPAKTAAPTKKPPYQKRSSSPLQSLNKQ